LTEDAIQTVSVSPLKVDKRKRGGLVPGGGVTLSVEGGRLAHGRRGRWWERELFWGQEEMSGGECNEGPSKE